MEHIYKIKYPTYIDIFICFYKITKGNLRLFNIKK